MWDFGTIRAMEWSGRSGRRGRGGVWVVAAMWDAGAPKRMPNHEVCVVGGACGIMGP